MPIAIERILHARAWIRILSSSVQVDISRVSAAKESHNQRNGMDYGHSMGHLRVPLSLYFKANLRAKFLLLISLFIHNEIWARLFKGRLTLTPD